MGTPEFAVPSLKILVENGYDVICAVMQKDKPKDRGHVMKAPPVKEYACSQCIRIMQPERLSRQPECVEAMAQLKPDLIVTCAFGQLLPDSVLKIPKYGTINVHGSLLPKYRGAAPIQWAVINGETVTGITTMLTDSGMDTGDMLLKETLEISEDMTAGELHDKMSLLGAEVLLKTIKALEEGTLEPVKQNNSEAVHAPRLTKETGLVDWTKSSREIHNLIRGVTPWPGAYSFLIGQRLKLWETQVMESNETSDALPGTILRLDQQGMLVQTGDGSILVRELQCESYKRMEPFAYACGRELKAGMRLG